MTENSIHTPESIAALEVSISAKILPTYQEVAEKAAQVAGYTDKAVAEVTVSLSVVDGEASVRITPRLTFPDLSQFDSMSLVQAEIASHLFANAVKDDMS